MAGAGYKLFQTGDVLTAAQVNTYLNEQTVMVFANAAARTSALTSVLAEGMVSYLQDTNAVEVYNGSAWVGVSGAGDVTEVQAGTGISVASGTGPIPVVTNTMATAIDAEGDLIIGDAADAFQRLAIGSNTHVLTVDTSVDGKIKWAAPAAGGLSNAVSHTVTLANITIGNGTVTSYYVESGDSVFYYGFIRAGSTTVFSSSFGVDLPVNSSTAIGVNAFYGWSSSAFLVDASASVYYPISCAISNVDSLIFYTNDSSSTYATATRVSPTVPVTLATNDEINWWLWYRKA